MVNKKRCHLFLLSVYRDGSFDERGKCVEMPCTTFILFCGNDFYDAVIMFQYVITK